MIITFSTVWLINLNVERRRKFRAFSVYLYKAKLSQVSYNTWNSLCQDASITRSECIVFDCPFASSLWFFLSASTLDCTTMIIFYVTMVCSADVRWADIQEACLQLPGQRHKHKQPIMSWLTHEMPLEDWLDLSLVVASEGLDWPTNITIAI